MIKEPKNIDFYTTGRHLSEEDFAKISQWINKQKSKKPKEIAKSKPYLNTSGNNNSYSVV
jgi:cytochrome c553